MISIARLPFRKALLDLRSLHPAAGVAAAVVGAPLPLLPTQCLPVGCVGGSPKASPTSRYLATEATDEKQQQPPQQQQTRKEPTEDLLDVLQKRRTAGETEEPKKKPTKETAKVTATVIDRSVKDRSVKTPIVEEQRTTVKGLDEKVLDDLFDLEPAGKSPKEDARTGGKPWKEGKCAQSQCGC